MQLSEERLPHKHPSYSDTSQNPWNPKPSRMTIVSEIVYKTILLAFWNQEPETLMKQPSTGIFNRQQQFPPAEGPVIKIQKTQFNDIQFVTL
jgi:hypothetical protein